MQLGLQRWNLSKVFYDQQTLSEHGDATERYAASSLSLNKAFPRYEQFWRYHVCPTTERPNAMTFRPGTADIVSVITQRNYTVFVYLLEAVEYLQLIQAGDLGLRNRHCYISMKYAGNALQVFAELQSAICGSPHALVGMQDLAACVGVSLKLFPNWFKLWGPQRELLSIYRNYLTHQGWVYSVFKTTTKQTLVLDPNAFVPNATYTWTHAEQDYQSNPSRWVDLKDVCKIIVDDTIAFLDLAYETMRLSLDPLLTNARYQALWGWQPGQSVPVMAAPRAPTIPLSARASGTPASYGI